MKCLSMKECVRMLLAFIEYANETRKFHDVGNYEYIVRTIKQVDKKVSNLEMEIAADDRNVNNLMDQVDSIGKELEAKDKENKQHWAVNKQLLADNKILTEKINELRLRLEGKIILPKRERKNVS